MIDFKYPYTKIINLLLASIVPFLVVGPFIPDLIVSISSLFFLFYVIKNKKFYYFDNKFFFIFLFFWVIFIISSLFSNDIFFSLKSSIFYFRIGVFSCLIWYLIEKDKSILSYFYYSLVFTFLILVIDGYYQYFNGENILGYKKYGIRIASFFKDELIMGSFLSRLFPLLFALFLVKDKKRLESYLIGFLFILVDVLIFISGERAAFFFLNLSTIFIIILIKKYQIFRLITFILGLICIFLLSLNSTNLTERMVLEPLRSLNFLKSSANEKPIFFTKNHDSHIRTAFEMFKSNPVLGHGPKMFRKKCSDPQYRFDSRSCTTHPHNFFIQLLAETGVLGFSYLFGCFFYVLYCAFRQIKSIILKEERYLTDYQVSLLGAILITVWPFSPNGNFFNNWLMIVYCLPVGFFLQSIYSKK
jgi:O-antigen ligase